MKNQFLLFAVLIFMMAGGQLIAQSKSDVATEQKINTILKKMTLPEKIAMLHGNALFSSDGIKRLGIPELTFDDGPLGVREEVLRFDWASARWTTDSATFFPNGSAVAATWNPALARKFGVAMGQEANARKKSSCLHQPLTSAVCLYVAVPMNITVKIHI